MDCSKCIFATGSPQDGCKVGRIEKFIERDKAERKGDFYSLSQFCNMYRDQTWDGGDDPVEKVIRQTKTSFGVAICDDLVDGTEELEKTLDSVEEAIINYDVKKVVVILSLSAARNPEDIVKLVNGLQSKGIFCEAIAHRFLFNDRIRETEVFQKIANLTYLTKIKGGDTIKPETFTSINQSIFHELEQIICFESQDAVIVHQNIVKSEYYNHKNFDDMSSTVRDFCSEKGVLGLI